MMQRRRSVPVDLAVSVIAFPLGFGALTRFSELSTIVASISSGLWFVAVTLSIWDSLGYQYRAPEIVRNVGGPLFAFLILAGISSLWSIAPTSTLYETVALAATCYLGGYVGAALGPVRACRYGVWAAAVVVAISLALVASGVRWATGSDGSALGLLTHRNSLGATAGLGLVLAASVQGVSNRSRMFLLVVCGSGLVASESRTAQVAAVVALCVMWIAQVFRKGRAVGLAVTFLGGALATLAWASFGGFGWARQGLGKSETLTGRTEIWNMVLSTTSNHRFMGLGFGATWVDTSPVARAVDQRFPGIASAHNLFLEALAGTGVIGVGLLVAYFVGRALKVRPSTQSGVTALGILMFSVVRGLGESGFPAKNSAALILLVAAFSEGTWNRATERASSGASQTVGV